MVDQAHKANNATDEMPAKAAPLRALRSAFCTRLRQAAVGVGDPARPAASVMCVQALCLHLSACWCILNQA